MLRRDEVKDGHVDAMCCVGPFYPKIVVFFVLVTKDVLVF
jgi:hypothetical protein